MCLNVCLEAVTEELEKGKISVEACRIELKGNISGLHLFKIQA